MKFAQVAVDAPIGAGKSFTYSIPPNMELEVGHGVWVPFGRRPAQGIVVDLTDTPEVEITKPVAGVIDPRPLLSYPQVQLAQWISHYYLAPLFESLALMAPPGFRRRLLTFYTPTPITPESQQSLTEEYLNVLSLFREKGRWEARELEERLGKARMESVLPQMASSGLLTRTWEWDKPRIAPKLVRWVRLTLSPEDTFKKAQATISSRAPKQAALLRLLAAEGRLPLSEALAQADATSQAAKALEKRGLLEFERIQVTAPKLMRWVRLTRSPEDTIRRAQALSASRAPKQAALLRLLTDKGSLPLTEALAQVGATTQVAKALEKQGLLEFEGVQVTAPKLTRWIRLTLSPEETLKRAQAIVSYRAPKQAALFKLLAAEGRLPLSEALAEAGATPQVAKALEKQGLLAFEEVQVTREPISGMPYPQETPLTLTPDQDYALQTIVKSLASPEMTQRVFLLHGITSSGKTEVYLRALAEALRLGKRGIVLVPEISLTPQTIQRFNARFPGRVAVLHSRLTPGQQFDEWWRIKNGEFDVVIGAMSAIFAPQPDLGLIVIDEEHEPTYKQEQALPYYHTRDVALKLAELTSAALPGKGAIVLLGSATPSLESYHLAQRGVYQLLEMPQRVPTISREGELPTVEVVDLKEELKAGNRSIFSRRLLAAMDAALASKEQVILFLNRRGSSSFIQCRDCAFVLRCRRCEIPLTYHAQGERLICHQCNLQMDTPKTCPQCNSRRIRFFGVGTQKVEEETRRLFPQARILRWDRDTATTSKAHEEILRRFQTHQADVLIGTQMIAKGLHFPEVSLVGVISADVGLHLPDFRAGERSFQLLSQVAGRAGRGEKPGLVIIQTYTPDHYAVSAALQQDYRAFHEKELAFRQAHSYPPFTRLARLLYQHSNQLRCQREAARVYELLRQERDSQGLPDISFIGPAPAYPPRLRGRSRWHLVIRSPEPADLLRRIPLPRGWSVDIDPMSLV